jgi:drug/metabolite transporter (DMT)-like permease
LTAGAVVAFAGNSWLCRAALRSQAIDAASFTAVRIASGAVVLLALLLARPSRRGALRPAGSWLSAGALFAYALAFSLAYLELPTGVGALILFGVVQVTMLAGGLLSGHRLSVFDGAGLALALAGLGWLTLPDAASPSAGARAPLLAALGMALAGVAWGLYSLRGREERSPPLAVTAGNFARATPLALAMLLAGWATSSLHANLRGIALALISGALTSGVGYAIWYAALPGLRPLQAGLVQLGVPVLTALGGVLLLSEELDTRRILSGLLVLSGITLAVAGPRSIASAKR